MVLAMLLQSAETWVERLGSDDPSERNAASVELLRLEAVEVLVPALKNSDPEIQGRAQELLERLGETASARRVQDFPELRELRDRREKEIIERTHDCGPGSFCFEKSGRQAERSEGPWFYFYAVHAGLDVSWTKLDPRYRGLLVRMFGACLANTECHVRTNVARELGMMGDREAVPALEKALNDPDFGEFAVDSVVTALARLGVQRPRTFSFTR